MEHAYDVLILRAALQMLVHWLRRLSCVFFQALVETTLGFTDVRFAAARALDSINNAVLRRKSNENAELVLVDVKLRFDVT